MFNPSDIYTESNFSNLFGCWTSPVTKFDTSSFYNWEQDNIPIVELEERTELLWERLGHPTSAVDGFSFVVSADATDECNSNIFTTLSGCLEKLPEVINSPYLIEVASFGELGELNLSNKIFGANGSIEIINRNYAKIHPLGYLNGSLTAYPPLNYCEYYNGGYLTSSLAITDEGDFGLLPSIPNHFRLAKVLSLNSTLVSSNIFDQRYVNNITVFNRSSVITNNTRMTVSLADTNTIASAFTQFNDFSAAFTPYEYSPDGSYNEFLDTYDVTSNYSQFDMKLDDSEGVAALIYANRLSKISVNNCNGKIYIRNFTVDGGGDFSGTERGIDIRNSNVLLEDCTTARCRKSGLYAENSNVILTRSFAAYRTYDFDSDSNRVGAPLETKLSNDYYHVEVNNLGAGIDLVNSNLTISSTYDREYETLSSMSDKVFGNAGINFIFLPTAGNIFCLSRNDVGIRAVNSTINGGLNELIENKFTQFDNKYHIYNLFLELNSDYGMLLENSKFNFSGRLLTLSNLIGLEANNSILELDNYVTQYNNLEGIRLNNSILKYNKDSYKPDVVALDTNSNRVSQLSLHWNGSNLLCNNSIIEPVIVSSVSSTFGRVTISPSLDEVTPQVRVLNNSFVHLINVASEVGNSNLITSDSVKGTSFFVDNNSKLLLRGTSEHPTTIIGPNSFTSQNNKAGLCAKNNSTITLQGPTLLVDHGVALLAEDSSTIEISPVQDGGKLLVSSFNLESPLNHTIVEIHSTRAGIVLNNNSNLKVKDLGNYDALWLNGTYGDEARLNSFDYTPDATYFSGGSLQFYPNPNLQSLYSVNAGIESLGKDIYDSLPTMESNGFNYIIHDISNPNKFSFSSYTNGGMCVRALNNSNIDLKNVHFPCGWWDASDVIYTSSGQDNYCSKTFIWNIADSSKLNADYISVNKKHPADSGYFGPSGVWTATASGAPSSTPDTGTVSLLDYYGACPSSSIHLYAQTSATNRGPFRLYFSIDPAINWAVLNTNGDYDGYFNQVYAQGYQASGNLIISGLGVSGNYKNVYLYNSQTSSVHASGFYYASSIINEPRTTRVMLDDSAANCFANAKHNSVGKSGLAKLVNIHYPIANEFGGESSETKTHGNGVKSVNKFDLEGDN